jgi:hypothetical protein
MKRRGCEKNHQGEISIPRIYTDGYQSSSSWVLRIFKPKRRAKGKEIKNRKTGIAQDRPTLGISDGRRDRALRGGRSYRPCTTG